MTYKIRYKKLVPFMNRLYKRLKARYDSCHSFLQVATVEEYDETINKDKTERYWSAGKFPKTEIEDQMIEYQEVMDEVSDKLFYVMSPTLNNKKFVIRVCADCRDHPEILEADDDMDFILANDELGIIEVLDEFFTECKNKLN